MPASSCAKPVLNVLLSRQALERYGDAIVRVVTDAAQDTLSLNWITPDSQPDAKGHYPCDIAFVSRDVTGASTKTQLQPSLIRYYEVLRASPALAWVHTHSSGADRPIFGELMRRGVRVSTSSGANAQSVAHTAVAAVLALGRRFPSLVQAQASKVWRPLLNDPHTHSFIGQHAMVVGLGPIGLQIATYLKALGLEVVGVTRDPARHMANPALTSVQSFSTFARHLHGVRYLILACPLTDTTQGLIDIDRLRLLPQGAYLINLARGEVVDQSALVACLNAGHLGGAFLDVFEVEPLPTTSPLWEMPNVMVSPHTAGHFSGYAQAVFDIFCHNLNAYVLQQPLCNVVQPST
jgi:phosphoglycerate dehydrogenase-like enzyme